jgi:hypothetical protein
MKNLILIVSLNFIAICSFSQSPVKVDIFGFSTNTTFTFHNVYDSVFMNKVVQISPNLLRFPGGFGNFYHLDGVGYGINIAEVNKYHKGVLPKRVAGIQNYERKKKINKNYINDFIYLAKHLKAEVIVDANILTASSDETIKIINKLLENNIEVVGIELGSELSNRSYMHLIDGDKYIQLAKDLAIELKSVFPNILLGVVAAPVTRNQERHRYWNELLAKEDFYDAIIIHSYAKVTKGKDKYGKMVSELPEGKSQKEAFFLYRERIINYFNNTYPEEIRINNSIFSDKAIWITEWNLQMSKITGNTLFQAIYVANYLLELSVSKSFSKIEIATFHNLAGRDVSGSILMNRGGGSEIHSTFYTFQMLSEMFNHKDLTIDKIKINDFCYVYTCRENNNEKYKYIINWSSEVQKISFNEVLSQTTLKECFGKELYFNNKEKRDINYTIEEVEDMSELEIKPYSVTLVTVKNEK